MSSSRLSWDATPARIQAWVAEVLGGPITWVADQSGGMSPGPATRVLSSSGRRAFVKAVGPELHPDTPELFRREVAVLRSLGPGPRWASLVDALDEGPSGWVALVLEDVVGRHPVLTSDPECAAVVAAVEDLATDLGRRPLPTTESLDAAGAHGVGLVDLAARLRMWADACGEVDLPDVEVPPAVAAAAPEVRERLLALAEQPMTQLVHWDIRVDNLLVRPSGELVVVDWGQAGAGTAWMDPLLARLDRAQDPWFDASVRATDSAALAALEESYVTAFVTGLGVLLAVRAVTHAEVGPPWPAGVPVARVAAAAARIGAPARLSPDTRRGTRFGAVPAPLLALPVASVGARLSRARCDRQLHQTSTYQLM